VQEKKLHHTLLQAVMKAGQTHAFKSRLEADI
jgi:hypothetical protein